MKKHIIYDNYDSDDYREAAIENLMENCGYSSIEDIPEAEIWDEIAEVQSYYFDDEEERLRDFFDGKKLLVCGHVGRWNGRFAAGKVIEYGDLWKCWADCDYISIYDEGGHFYIKSSHHDGTNLFEVKILTEKGAELFDRWDYSWDIWENLSEREVHQKLWKNSKYTHIPHFARDVYGYKTR